MGFNFTPSVVDVEINGQTYSASIGDPDLLYRINAFAQRLAKSNYLEMDGNMFQAISDDIHQFVAELLGAENEQTIFDGIKRDVIQELQLFTWLNREINKNNALLALDATLGEYSVASTL